MAFVCLWVRRTERERERERESQSQRCVVYQAKTFSWETKTFVRFEFERFHFILLRSMQNIFKI